MLMNQFAVRALISLSLGLTACAKTKSDDTAPAAPTLAAPGGEAPTTPPAAPSAPATLDSAVVGVWSIADSQHGVSYKITSTLNADGTTNQKAVVDGETVTDIDLVTTTNTSTKPKQMEMKVTTVRVDTSEKPLVVGEVVRCVYEMPSATQLKMDCAEDANAAFPDAVAPEALVYSKE